MLPKKSKGKEILSRTSSGESSTSTKDRVEVLETSLGMMQDEMQRMRTTMEDSFGRLMEAMTNNRDNGPSASRGSRRSGGSPGSNPGQRGENINPFAPPLPPLNHNRHVKLDFPRFQGGDPTELLSKVRQYFEYQEMPREQQVRFASFLLMLWLMSGGKPSRGCKMVNFNARNDRHTTLHA